MPNYISSIIPDPESLLSLEPEELDRLLTLYERVAHKTLRISKMFGIEGRQLLTPQDEYAALKVFNQIYEGTPSQAEAMRLAYREVLTAHPGLEDRLIHFPQRIFSGRAHPSPDTRAVFFCYNLPAKNPATGGWDTEVGFSRWYLYDLQNNQIIDDTEQINTLISSEPDTPRKFALTPETLTSIRKKMETHIKNTYLKAVQAPVGVKAVLKAWMELN